MNYFIFANYPDGKYNNSIWDTRNIIRTGNCYFRLNVDLVDRLQKGDKIIFKEFRTQVYWGEATVQDSFKPTRIDDTDTFLIKINNINKWLYTANRDALHSKLSNKATRSRIVSITEQDYNLIKQEMEKNSVISEERQEQLKTLWKNYNDSYGEDRNEISRKYDTLMQEWNIYKAKIKDGSFSIDDYTNILANSKDTLPGGYLCNFLERTSRSLFGSSKPGNAFNFGVKLNNDNTTYTLGKKNPKATKEEAVIYFNANIKPIISGIVNSTHIADKIRFVEDSDFGAKQILRKLAVLDHQMAFIYIYSNEVISELYDELINGNETQNLDKNEAITTVLKKLLDLNDSSFIDRYILSRFLWMYTNIKGLADDNSPNVILYGPPGTGKTYAVQQTLDFLCQGDRSRYEVIQFHPSFTYEDFIEGVKPKGITKDGNIKFELVNGLFKRFCIKGKNNPSKKYYFVVDEINRANLSSVFGETLSRIEKDYRHDVESTNTNTLIKTQYSTLIEHMEEEEKEKLAYELIDGNAYFGVPKNVYFIGMMNDVDKNIDAFDLALRRRFKWIHKGCDYDVIAQETKYRSGGDFNNIDSYVEACKDLNTYISEKLGLGKSYEFGHSFFMKMSVIAKHRNITDKNIQVLFDLYLKPTLKEYLRSIFSERELDKRLEESLNVFKQPFIKKKA
jgi:5-methylcytosine-specific restriction protein B